MGHQVVEFQYIYDPLFMCEECGGYSSSRLGEKLGAKCKAPTKQKVQELKRVFELNLHPKHNVRLGNRMLNGDCSVRVANKTDSVKSKHDTIVQRLARKATRASAAWLPKPVKAGCEAPAAISIYDEYEEDPWAESASSSAAPPAVMSPPPVVPPVVQVTPSVSLQIAKRKLAAVQRKERKRPRAIDENGDRLAEQRAEAAAREAAVRAELSAARDVEIASRDLHMLPSDPPERVRVLTVVSDDRAEQEIFLRSASLNAPVITAASRMQAFRNRLKQKN
jgi:hypothetical protein